MTKRKTRKKLQPESDFMRVAVARMLAAPCFFNAEQRAALDSYDGPVVSGDPEGRLPTNPGAAGKKRRDRQLPKPTKLR